MASSYEEKVIKLLQNGKINFYREKTFSDLRKGRYRYDFFLTDLNIIIECDGEYHWKAIRGKSALQKQQEADRRKNSYCLANSIPLYRIPYWELPKIKKAKELLQDKYLVKSKWHNDKISPP